MSKERKSNAFEGWPEEMYGRVWKEERERRTIIFCRKNFVLTDFVNLTKATVIREGSASAEDISS